MRPVVDFTLFSIVFSLLLLSCSLALLKCPSSDRSIDWLVACLLARLINHTSKNEVGEAGTQKGGEGRGEKIKGPW